MSSTQQLMSVDETRFVHRDSTKRLLLLISELEDGLNDAITLARLKVLCEAIADESEKANLLYKRSKAA